MEKTGLAEDTSPTDEARLRGMRLMYGNLMPPPSESLDLSLDLDNAAPDPRPSGA